MRMTSPAPRWREAALLVVLAVTALVHLALAWPASLSNDATMQWAQVAANRLNDWHPPAMTRLWQALTVFGAGPRPLLVFTIVMYWSAFAALSWALLRQGRPGVACAAVGTGLIAALVWFDPTSKDSLLTAFFVLAFALLLIARSAAPPRTVLIGVAIVLLLCGVLMRHNGAFAAGPALILAIAPKMLRRFWPSLVVSGAIAALLALGVQMSNREVFGAAPSRVEDSLLLFDLLGIAHGSGDISVFGPESRITQRDVARCYSPVMWDTMAPWGRCPWFPEKAGAKLLNQPELIAGQVPPASVFKSQWLGAVIRHPLAYVVHRMRHMNAELLLFTSTKPRNGIVPVTAEELAHPPVDTLPTRMAKYTVGVVLSPVVVVAITIVAFGLLFLRARREDANSPVLWTALAMSASALLYAGSYAVVGVATAPRYYLLTAVLGAVALAIGVADKGVRTLLRTRRGVAAACLAIPLLAMAGAEIGRIFVPIPAPTLLLEP